MPVESCTPRMEPTALTHYDSGSLLRIGRKVVLAGRPLSRVVRAVVGRPNYVALWNMARLYPRGTSTLCRYLFGIGKYPTRLPVRTPLGMISPTLFSHHDLLTLNEVFCRRDYPADGRTRVVVDLGSNIGLSALYFLTRNETIRAYLFEPVPSNLSRLRDNLDRSEIIRYELFIPMLDPKLVLNE